MLTRRPSIIVGVTVVVSCAFLAICALVTLQMRRDAAQRAQDAARNVSLLVERDTARNLELYDLSLQAVIEGLKEPGLADLPPALRQMVLFDRSATAKNVGALFVVNEAGEVIYDSRSVPPRRLHLADADYFKVHRDSPNAGLYVSRPFQPQLPGDGGMSIALSRRLSHPDGSFAGIVVGTLCLDYFRNLFAGMNLGPHGSMALMLNDGTMLMRRPYDPQIIGCNLTGTANFTRFTQAPSGSFYGTAAIDGVERWYAFRHIEGFPVLLDVALSTDDMYAEWRRRAWVVASLVSVLALIIIGLAILFSQQLKRRLAVESKLRVLARTDALTGLGNRHAFDEIAQTEWHLAECAGHPLSVLLIDVDHFKGFNDLYGHAAGDDALAAVAHCIRQGLRRPADHAARWGGEEFIVLLPATSTAGARLVAESIRTAVEALGLRHVSSTHQVLTISVGVACTERRAFQDLRALFRAADTALYTAKASGRNRTMCGAAADSESAAGMRAAPARSNMNDA